MAFLDQVAQVRAFMAPVMDRQSDRTPVEYTLLVGSGDFAREERWRYGDSLHVATRVDSLGNETPVYAGGGWAPLRHLMADSSSVIRYFHPQTKIELVVPPVFPAVAPEIIVPRPR
jgi:hypothetical protein